MMHDSISLELVARFSSNLQGYTWGQAVELIRFFLRYLVSNLHQTHVVGTDIILFSFFLNTGLDVFANSHSPVKNK